MRDLSPLERQYASARPFPHAVVDEFWEPIELGEAERELRAMDTSSRWWEGGDNDAQVGKFKLSDLMGMPETARKIASALNGPETLANLEALTGIAPLLPDWGFWGGGVHQTFVSGRLAMHADFNRHPVTGRHRRLNLLLYANSRYEAEHGGELELWSPDMLRCEVSVEPVFNRAVVFTLGDASWHGHPNPWKSAVSRLSFAAYYYTEHLQGSDDAVAFRDVVWKARPGGAY